MITTLIAAATFQFPGGSTAELANAVSEATGKPVVLLYNPEPKLRAAKFAWEEPKDMVRELRNTFGFVLTGSEAIGLGPRTLTPALLDTSVPNNRQPQSGIQLTDGKVTAKAETGKYALFSELWSRLGQSGNVHWALREMPIAVAASQAPVADVAEAATAAVGGKWVEKTLTPSWPTFRDRLTAGYDDLAKKATDRAVGGRYGLASQFLRNLPESELIKLFAVDGNRTTIRADRSNPLYSAAWTIARNAYNAAAAEARTQPAAPPTQPKRGQRGGPPPLPPTIRVASNDIVARAALVDPRQPVEITFIVRKGVTLSFLGESGKSVLTIP